MDGLPLLFSKLITKGAARAMASMTAFRGTLGWGHTIPFQHIPHGIMNLFTRGPRLTHLLDPGMDGLPLLFSKPVTKTTAPAMSFTGAFGRALRRGNTIPFQYTPQSFMDLFARCTRFTHLLDLGMDRFPLLFSKLVTKTTAQATVHSPIGQDSACKREHYGNNQ
jgi:hypothetical protein